MDLAGDGEVVATLHTHLGDAVVHSAIVGATHWDAASSDTVELPGATRSFFFAPDHLERRRADWGPGGVEERFAVAWASFVEHARSHITVVHGDGPDAVRRVLEETLRGAVAPAVAHVLSMVGDDRGHLSG